METGGNGMLKFGLRKGFLLALLLCVLFSLVCAVSVFLPVRTVQHRADAALLLQGNDDPGRSIELSPGALVDINTATEEELRLLPGIGETLAQRIVEYRTEHGAFESIEELTQVSGIGEGRLKDIRELITAEGAAG